MPVANPRRHLHGDGGLALHRSQRMLGVKRCQCRRPHGGDDLVLGLRRRSQSELPRPHRDVIAKSIIRFAGKGALDFVRLVR